MPLPPQPLPATKTLPAYLVNNEDEERAIGQQSQRGKHENQQCSSFVACVIDGKPQVVRRMFMSLRSTYPPRIAWNRRKLLRNKLLKSIG